MTQTAEDRVVAQILEELRLYEVRDAAQDDPKALINEIRYFDPTTELWVEFRMFPPEGWEPVDLTTGPAEDWFWQAQIQDWWHDPKIKRYLLLKARQLGITLQAVARAVWLMLYRPGSASVAFSYEEGEAKKLVEAGWMMFLSLPEILRNGVEVITPRQAELPAEWIKLKHPDGRISTFQALPATKKHGHGGRLTWAILDEFARQEYGESVFTAINPAISRGAAKLAVISTANGVGDFFHRIWLEAKERNIAKQFLPWNLEPTRDEHWYAENAMALGEVERNQQYPLTESDAFMLSGDLYFDRDALNFYRHEIVRPRYAGQFILGGNRKAFFTHNPQGCIEVYEEPRANGEYAISVDVSTGRGTDYNSGDVIDLSSGAVVAHFHAKMDAPLAAVQFHYLGLWYNEARIAPERQGGYGEALIVFLRDGIKGLPPYPKLYRHTKYTNGAKPISSEYGFPMNVATRPQVLEGLKTMLRERAFPWMTAGHMSELGTFVYANTHPSPRAQDGCNDDRVMSLAIAADLYRQFGHRPDRVNRTKWKKRPYRPHPSRTH